MNIKLLLIGFFLLNNICWYLFTNTKSVRRFFRNAIERFKRLSYKNKALLTTLFLALLSFAIYLFTKWLFNVEFDLSIYITVTVSIIALIQIYKSSQKEIYGLMHIRSKERIKILSEFSPKRDLIGNKSIYNTIIDVLKRCSKANLKNSQLKILVCSPLIDYPERKTNSIDDWGDEFMNIIKEIMNNAEKNVHIDIFHLPDTTLNGVNPLKSFTEVLSNFFVSEDSEPSTKNFETIWKKTESFITDMNKMDTDINSPFSVNRTIVTDIPFQIVIYKSTDINEVIVSFAGKKILEDESLTEPYGFHSVDVDVVEAFENIFNSYVQEKRRNPIKPIHTLDLINESRKKGKHSIENYLQTKKYDNVIERFDINPIQINIGKDTFSPAFANSSKFTSLVIKNILGKKDKVMEIGAGSGIQSIVAYNTLSKLGNTQPLVYAIECEDSAFKLLNENLTLNNLTRDEKAKTGITILNAELYSEVTTYNYKQKSKGYEKTEKDKKWGSPAKSKLEEYCTIRKDYIAEITNGALYGIGADNNQPKEIATLPDNISFLIADLPYVDTSTKENGLERAFFDPNHNAHKTLFNFFAKSSIFSNDARLVTSFSTLGGEDDLTRFELMINECNLYILHKQCFVEANYEWIVYTIYKNNNFNWWDYLSVKVKEDESSSTT